MGQPQKNHFGILMYHRVTPRVEGICEPTWNVPPDRFRRQLTGLLSRGYRAWPLQRVLACHAGREPIPARTFVMTFDDGYESLYYHAWPVLKELKVPATIFAATDYLDSDAPFPFDDWSASGAATVPAAAWKPLTTAHCVEMVEHGLIDIGSHTHTHDDFVGRPEHFRSDLARSVQGLRSVFGYKDVSFAFPFGRYGEDLLAVAKEMGMTCALNTEPRVVEANTDPFHWGRFAVTSRDTGCTLTLKLNGWYTTIRAAWHWMRRPWRLHRVPSGARVEVPRKWNHRKPTNDVGVFV